MTTQQYQQASEHFLAQARGELAEGDLPQASENGWGAVVHILKSVGLLALAATKPVLDPTQAGVTRETTTVPGPA